VVFVNTYFKFYYYGVTIIHKLVFIKPKFINKGEYQKILFFKAGAGARLLGFCFHDYIYIANPNTHQIPFIKINTCPTLEYSIWGNEFKYKAKDIEFSYDKRKVIMNLNIWR
jgi:hypothetical protein